MHWTIGFALLAVALQTAAIMTHVFLRSTGVCTRHGVSREVTRVDHGRRRNSGTGGPERITVDGKRGGRPS